MRENPPIIFIHRGEHDYYKAALMQARAMNTSRPVIALHDKGVSIPGVECALIRDYSGNTEKFSKIYTHISVNGAEYELFCYLRWFRILEFVVKNNIGSFFVFDSDVLIFNDLLRFQGEFKDKKHGNFVWANFFDNAESLNDFCEYLLYVYSNKEILSELSRKYRKGQISHLSDMECMFEYCRRKEEYLGMHDLCRRGCDMNVNYSDGFIMENGMKKIVLKNGKAFSATPDGKYVEFCYYHFQGGAKKRMMEVFREASSSS